MRILALETSGMSGEVALLEGERVIDKRLLPTGERTARSLTPTMAAILADAGWQPADVELIAVTIGPGSFTGLRVGATTAKTFAYAVGGACLGVDTLEVMAAQATNTQATELWSVMDAQRQQLFAARYQRLTASPTVAWQLIAGVQVIDNDRFLDQLPASMAVTGIGLQRLADRLPAHTEVIDSSLWQPRAATVGQLAWRDHQAGRRDDLWTLAPHYIRPSAAEEKQVSAKKNV